LTDSRLVHICGVTDGEAAFRVVYPAVANIDGQRSLGLKTGTDCCPAVFVAEAAGWWFFDIVGFR
jgi:hypothetical protein